MQKIIIVIVGIILSFKSMAEYGNVPMPNEDFIDYEPRGMKPAPIFFQGAPGHVGWLSPGQCLPVYTNNSKFFWVCSELQKNYNQYTAGKSKIIELEKTLKAEKDRNSRELKIAKEKILKLKAMTSKQVNVTKENKTTIPEKDKNYLCSKNTQDLDTARENILKLQAITSKQSEDITDKKRVLAAKDQRIKELEKTLKAEKDKSHKLQVQVLAKDKALDLDQDGVVNSKDLCPQSADHNPVNVVGCDSDLLGVVYFNTGSSRLTEKAKIKLQHIIMMLQQHSQLNFVIWGYADNVGSIAANLKLSEARAKSVAKYFAMNGINMERLKLEGKGEAMPDVAGSDDQFTSRRRAILYLEQ